MKLYIGNLPHSYSEEELSQLFTDYPSAKDFKIILNRETGQSRGFGFVVVDVDDEATQAITELNGKEVEGRSLVVNEARPQEPRGPRRNNFSGNRRRFN